jgi:hypothetical protein
MRATVRLALWLLVRLVPLQKAIIQIDLNAQFLHRVGQLLNQFGIGKLGNIIRFLLFATVDIEPSPFTWPRCQTCCLPDAEKAPERSHVVGERI